MLLANYNADTPEPQLLENIESTPISSNVVVFEKEIGLNPFEMHPDEVDLYRPNLYQILSKETEENNNKDCYKKGSLSSQ